MSKLLMNKLDVAPVQSRIMQILRDLSPISRSGIVYETGLPHSAISRAVADMLERELVTEERFGDASGPRRKKGLRINPDVGYCIAVDYAPEGIEGVVMDMSYKAVFKESQKVLLGPLAQEEKIAIIKSFIQKMQEKAATLLGKYIGIALVDPGIINVKAGIAITSTMLANWENVSIVKIMEEQFKVPVMLLNTSLAKIRAVDRLELRSRYGNVIYVEYGEGIACGLKVEGNYVAGGLNLAGELGHVNAAGKQVPCRCGGIGCLEAVAALPALAKAAKNSISDNSSSTLAKINEINGLDVLEAAGKGDRLASRIVDEAFECLGRSVAGLVNVLNPEVVVFDNMVSKGGNEILTILVRNLDKNLCSHYNLSKLDVRISTLESHVGALGAASAVMDYYLEG